MNNLKNIALSVENDDSTGQIKYYFDGKEVENVQIDLSSLHAGDFVYCRRKDSITKAVVLSSGPDAAMLVYVEELWLNGAYRSSYTHAQKYLLTNNSKAKWVKSLYDVINN